MVSSTTKSNKKKPWPNPGPWPHLDLKHWHNTKVFLDALSCILTRTDWKQLGFNFVVSDQFKARQTLILTSLKDPPFEIVTRRYQSNWMSNNNGEIIRNSLSGIHISDIEISMVTVQRRIITSFSSGCDKNYCSIANCKGCHETHDKRQKVYSSSVTLKIAGSWWRIQSNYRVKCSTMFCRMIGAWAMTYYWRFLYSEGKKNLRKICTKKIPCSSSDLAWQPFALR